MDIMDIMDIMEIMDIMDIMDIMIITAWMAMAGAVSALFFVIIYICFNKWPYGQTNKRTILCLLGGLMLSEVARITFSILLQSTLWKQNSLRLSSAVGEELFMFNNPQTWCFAVNIVFSFGFFYLLNPLLCPTQNGPCLQLGLATFSPTSIQG